MSILCEHNNETEDGWTVRKSEGEKCKRPSLHDEHLERSIWAKESILVKSWEQAHMSKRIVKKKSFWKNSVEKMVTYSECEK